MTLHVVGLPFESSPACAYEGKVKRFAPMMRAQGYDVTVYGPEHYGGVVTPQCADRVFDPNADSWRAMNDVSAGWIRATAEPGDVLCLIAGLAQQSIMDALPHMRCVEFGIGYGGVIPAAHHVFESYAWMHTVLGSLSGSNPHNADGRWYDAVIPNYFDVAAFPEGTGGDYLLYLGRLIERKGVEVAVEAAKHAGRKLIVAGEGDYRPEFGEVEYVGLVGPAERAELLGGALALIAPTIYVEPFGGVAAEAMLCGTPVIASDWGAFTETVRHGIDGYRCRTLAEFVSAIENDVEHLDRSRIRRDAIARWSTEAVGSMYAEYFARLDTLNGDGWYAMPDDGAPTL